MKWLWKPKYSVCFECGVHFEPVTTDDARWGNLCSTHRKPVQDRDRRKDAVMDWASRHWEELVEAMETEKNQQCNPAFSASQQQAGIGLCGRIGSLVGV